MLNLFKTALLAAFTASAMVAAAPASSSALETRQSSGFWMGSIQRQGTVPFGNSGFKVFRNVKDYGARGDGSTDDTAAINAAITDGGRCGQGCDSSTTTPAIVYFPPGTYAVSNPIVQLYYTQLIGDATSPPTLKALPNFQGMAVIDSDPYADGGINWYTNQNNFYRQVRNFVIDLTAMPATAGAGIHWQVAQATSLQNIVFNMVQGSQSKQLGIFMDNGSGGFMSDLTFNGGNYGAFFGNQQFTTRNLVFNNCQTAIYMNWNWVWTLKGIKINNCGVGIDANSISTVGSIIAQDISFTNTPVGIISGFEPGTWANGTLVVDNVDFSGCQVAIQGATSKNTLLAGGSKAASWVSGHGYSTSGSLSQAIAVNSTNKTHSTYHRRSTQIPLDGPQAAVNKPQALLASDGTVFERSKPQYADQPASAFISVKSKGARGDGSTDDTAAIQSALDSAGGNIVYFDHGAYLVTDTIRVPKDVKIVGEIWPIIFANGPSFSDVNNPKPVFQVGQSGDVGSVEIQDLIFETKGPAPGAILVEWNVNQASQGSAAMWDTHFRIGGTAGTGLQSDTCRMNNGTTHGANAGCEGAFMLLHVTKSASLYMENVWGWVADHELDLSDHSQIDIYNGRGVLIESAEGPVWAYGTSFEHSQMYNYQISNAKNVYLGAIQTETPYWQSNPTALTPFTPSQTYFDPTFSTCSSGSSGAPNTCAKAWGLRVTGSSDVLVYGAGLYSFFDNYDQDCLLTESCQDNMVSIESSNGGVYLLGLNTKAATNMITVDNNSLAQQSDNPNNFCQTVAMFRAA